MSSKLSLPLVAYTPARSLHQPSFLAALIPGVLLTRQGNNYNNSNNNTQHNNHNSSPLFCLLYFYFWFLLMCHLLPLQLNHAWLEVLVCLDFQSLFYGKTGPMCLYLLVPWRYGRSCQALVSKQKVAVRHSV